jgi:core-2/I-Branching enzyme
MKIAYLVFAYKNPQLLKRVIGMLSSEDCAFFIHIDQKSSIKEFSGIRGENIFFSEKRIPVYWAEFSGVQAILLLVRQAMEGPQDYDYFVLLSGSEYPLRSGRYIRTSLEENRGLEFINIVKMPAPGKPISRINTLRYPSDKPVRRFASRVLAKLGLAQRDYRKYLGSLEPYSGITWWALTRDACQYILEFVARNQHMAEYFQNVFAPEETFFHTILGNSAFRSRIHRNLCYEDWSVPGGHPAMINGKHVAFFEAQEKVCVNDVYGPGELLFARKFSDDSLDLLQRIDDMIERKEKCRTSPQFSVSP